MKKKTPFYFFEILITIFAIFVVIFFIFPQVFSSSRVYKQGEQTQQDKNISNTEIQKPPTKILAPLDTVDYDKRLLALANNPTPPSPTTKIVKDPKTGLKTTVLIPPKPIINIWPVKTAYPNAGAILPFHRIIAYYGNLYSNKMGVLGEYPEDQMLSMLNTEVQKWTLADPNTPALPAIHYIAVVAQGSAGADGKYRFRMPDSEIDKVIAMADKINGIVFLDVQVGLSDVATEVPRLEKYLKMPQVHLALDPEFSMKTGVRPGKVVGTMDATDINFAVDYLSKIVKDNNLPPKILIVHRYTQKMLTNYKLIKTAPEVQIVINMDGWGGQAKKIGTYNNYIYPEPVELTGFKLFYKNDVITPGTEVMTPESLLKLRPIPIYIQYQ